MNTVNETKTFSSLPEEESALWERMRDTLLCLQTDNSISVKDLASRLAYSTQEFLYLTFSLTILLIQSGNRCRD